MLRGREWFDKAHHKSNPLLSGPLGTASEVRPIETVNLVAGAGIEPASVAYETTEVPVLYPAAFLFYSPYSLLRQPRTISGNSYINFSCIQETEFWIFPFRAIRK